MGVDGLLRQAKSGLDFYTEYEFRTWISCSEIKNGLILPILFLYLYYNKFL